ncbi:MAG: rRNA adenine N-6-methyltransferase family protein, partial [Psychromonas sp.]
TPPFIAKSLKVLNQVCSMAFNQRRKTIRNSWRDLLSVEQLQSIGIETTKRAENITVEEYVKVANYVFDQQDKPA